MSQILVGISGFSWPDWKGMVYPGDLKKRGIHELEYVAQFVDFCEINTSPHTDEGSDWESSFLNCQFEWLRGTKNCLKYKTFVGCGGSIRTEFRHFMHSFPQ